MDESLKRRILVGIILLLMVSIIAYFYFYRGSPRNFIEVEGLYNSDHQLISHGFNSIVGGIEGVKYLKFRINVENRDKVPLTIYVSKLTPKEIEIVKPNEKYSIISGGTGRWITGFVDIEPYEGVIQDFCATVISEEILFLRPASKIEGCIAIKIDKSQLTSDFEIQLDSGSENNVLNPGCTESWVCSDYGTCVNSAEKRTCADINNCGTEISKPIESRICTISNPLCIENWECGSWSSCTSGFISRICNDKNNCGSMKTIPTLKQICSSQTDGTSLTGTIDTTLETNPIIEPQVNPNPTFTTNAINGNYKSSEVWIMIDGRKYYYYGYSSYHCLTSNVIVRTPESYPVCTRDGYEITQRVYLQIVNYGLIFKP